MARGDYWFVFPFRVRYAEIDGQGVVFNANYLMYFDTAITEYIRALGYDYADQPASTGTDFHTVKALVEYREPIRFDDEIEVAVRAGRVGSSSLTFALEIHPKGEDRVLSSGEIVWVNAYVGQHKSAPLPEDLVAKIREREPA